MAPSVDRKGVGEQSIEDLVLQITKHDLGKDIISNYRGGFSDNLIEKLPETTRKRFDKAGIDLSKGYPQRPDSDEIPLFIDEAKAIRDKELPYIERGKNADPEKRSLFSHATQVIDLSKHIGTEIVGLQLKDLTDQQKDELALLVAERVVVFFRDQDLSPQKQLELGAYWGNVEEHAQQVHVPAYRGITVIWPELARSKGGIDFNFKNASNNLTANWHTDLTHELQPPGITHLHNDAIPNVGGDTVWASGYGAYDKLSPAFKQFLDGKKAVYFSAHQYIDRDAPLKGRVNIEREHPIIRTHPVTGWKSLFVNRKMTRRIVGLEPEESALILEYLFSIFEKNLDIQVRFNWKPTKPGLGTSAIWDNRISEHFAIRDYSLDDEQRHGTRVSSLAEIPYFDPNSKSQREDLGLD